MSLEATSLLGVMASISSMNRMHGLEVCKEGNVTVSVVSLYLLHTTQTFMKHLTEVLESVPGYWVSCYKPHRLTLPLLVIFIYCVS